MNEYSKNLFNIVLVQSKVGLEKFISTILKNEKIIAIDVESDRNHRFGHNLSLIQVGTRTHQFIIDPLSFSYDKTMFRKEFSRILTKKSLLKLFYSGIEDIQVLKRDFCGQISNVFDVQIAYSLTRQEGSLTTMVGLDKLMKQELGLNLPSHVAKLQRMDWSIRPLTQDMLKYASFDVLGLIVLYEKFLKVLKTHTLYPEYLRYFFSLQLVEPINADVAEHVLFMKTLHFDELTGLDLLLVYRIHQFRLQKGKQVNRPYHFVLGKKDINLLIENKPKSLKAYDRLNIRKFRNNLKFKKQIVALIKQTISDYEQDPTIVEREVTPIISVVNILGRRDLYLLNEDFSLNLPFGISLEMYKKRKEVILLWRKEKVEELQRYKELVLSSHTINYLARFSFESRHVIPIIPGISQDFSMKYGEEIMSRLDQANVL